MKIRKSYGIACCRIIKGEFQILMIKKSITYHFCEFVLGKYHKRNYKYLMNLFNNMTYHEKIDILSLKYLTLWYRIYQTNPEDTYFVRNKYVTRNSYLTKKNKFESLFLYDGGKHLRKLINSSFNADTLWEIPKGRKDTDEEKDINASIREFYEETCISGHNYKLLWHCKPLIETYIDLDVQYRNIYYLAEATHNWNPKLFFNNKQQLSEISQIKWINFDEIKYLNLPKNTKHRTMIKFNNIKKIFKKY